MNIRKRLLSFIICGAMAFSAGPLTAFAGDSVYTGGLCEHHTDHNDECGYIEAVEGSLCTHEHTDDCYRLETDCVHEHTEDCYSDGVLPADDAEKEADACAHECGEESGCITKELDCNHEHNEDCGYVEAVDGSPCGYWCEICAGETEESDKTDVTDETDEKEEPECECDTLCTEDEVNEDCPVCSENWEDCEGTRTKFSPMSARAITPTKPEGDGTKEEPYQISTAAELYWFAGLVNGDESIIGEETKNTTACAELTADITINENVLDEDGNLNEESVDNFIQWTPIGKNTYVDERYRGTFDGNGHTISGLYVDSDARYIGLFGYVGNGGTIQNVGVVDSYISNTKNYANVGGVCGYNEGSIKNSYNTGSVSGTSYVSGVCGVNCSTIENCYNTGSVSGTSYVSGVCGKNYEGTIENSYNTGEVSGTSYVSGVCGENLSGTIENCYNTGEVTGEGAVSYVGGVCWKNSGTIKNCYNTGEVTGEGEVSYVGGVCVENQNGTIENCYNTGSVSGSGNNVGGVCGYNNNGTIENCYNTGEVSGSGNNVGGVCGLNNGAIENSYYLEGTADSYDDEDVLSEEEFGDQNSFNTDWNFTYVWNMNSILGRPLLKNNTEIIDGTEEKPYLIYNVGQLKDFAKVVNSENTDIHAKLMNDITINDNVLGDDGNLIGDGNNFEQWTPIGNDANPYTGTFDGNGHTISGLYVDSDARYIGLFGCVGNGGTIQNVGVVDSYISNTKNYANVGGVCGWNLNGTIKNSYNTGTVSGDTAGGVCGQNSNSTIENCYNTGVVKGGNDTGGIVGYNNEGGSIVNCYNTGSVTGNDDVGGITGYNRGGSVTECYNTGSVTGTNNVGGISAYNNKDGKIESCYNIGTLTASQSNVGGISAFNNGGSTISNCYNTGSLTGSGYIGGIVGSNGSNSAISDCYYLDTIAETGTGTNSGTVNNTEAKTEEQFSSGEVTHLLQNGQEDEVWGQEIGTNELPRLSDDEDDKVCKVTFMNGGDEVKTVYINMGKTIEEPDIDVGKGFYVDGWYTDSDFGGDEWDFENDTIDDDITLYADVEERKSSGGSYSLPEGIDRDEPEEEPEAEPDTPGTTGFIDVSIFDWYYDGVMYATENGIMNGVGGNRFEPETELKREMLAVILWNMTDNPEPNGIAPFLDVTSDKYYAKAIAWANENGVMYGYGEEFGVGEAVTREDFAAILYRYAAFKGYDTTQGGMAIREFIDFDQIADYAVEALGWAVNSGIISGMGDGTISPKATANRGQAAVMLMKFCENVIK